jgi:acyl-CoA synthetase (AMP-forming)/AMP-acid ligase II
LLYPPGLDFVTAFLGCLYAGTIAVPVELPRRNRNLSRLESVIDDAQPTVILTDAGFAAFRDRVNGSTQCLDRVDWFVTDELPDGLENDWSEISPSPDDIAMLQYTSGSTASPRGVVITHGNIAHNSEFIRRSFQHTSESRGLSWLPHSHDMGLMGGILHPLYTGFPVTLMPPLAVMQKPLRWLQAISASGATTSGAPNFAYEFCVDRIRPEDRKRLDLSRWEIALNGSEPVRAETLDRFAEAFRPCGFRREAFFPCYGLAEATLLVSGAPKAEPPTIRDRADVVSEDHASGKAFSPAVGSGSRMVSCGQTDPDWRLAIVDPESNSPCAEGEVGEIWLSGPSVAAGYWKRPLETERTFRATLAHAPAEHFLRTGDLGVIRGGHLYLMGRLKDLIIVAGLNHHPEDIERSVERCVPQIGSACCAAFSVLNGGEEELVLAVELDRHSWKKMGRDRQRTAAEPEPFWRRISLDRRPATRSASSDLAKELRGSIQQAVVQNHGIRAQDIVFLPPGELPKTSSGKIPRRACADAYLGGIFAGAVHGSRSPTRQTASASEAGVEGSQ